MLTRAGINGPVTLELDSTLEFKKDDVWSKTKKKLSIKMAAEEWGSLRKTWS